ncbi:hypothetical protein GCM10011366_13070 [Ornithinimicrobium tianjinense]|uniref:Uncharacterized protein n=1 Tax=Ornithinimicrobium tianjinense TaxID=1195761 RepID=A0A917BJS2_9MICO|nr:hypothetical protein GCM10011366_13070 [Ornithinimicrobium tianjinense]
MLQPGAEAHEERASDESTGDDVEQSLVAQLVVADLQPDHDGTDDDAESDEELVQRDWQADAEQVAQRRVHGPKVDQWARLAQAFGERVERVPVGSR